MIDFRFHMVSLAAVLIALSVGIVLGAGPLNDDIGNTLTNEVNRLRQDKDDLRRQLTDEQRTGTARESFEEQVLPAVLAGELTDSRVTLVRLPESEDAAAGELEESLESAGATVGPTVSVSSAWTATGEDAQASRDEVARELLQDLGRPAGADVSLDSILGTLLGARTGDGSPTPGSSRGKSSATRPTSSSSSVVPSPGTSRRAVPTRTRRPRRSPPRGSSSRRPSTSAPAASSSSPERPT